METSIGKTRCSSCGAELDVPVGTKLRTMIAGASGRPNMLVLSVDGNEIHRCEAQSQIEQSEEDESEIQMS